MSVLETALSADHPRHIHRRQAAGETSGIITMNKGWVSTAAAIHDLGPMLFQPFFSEVEPHCSPTYLEPSSFLICNQLLPPNLHRLHYLQIFLLSTQTCVQRASWDGVGRKTHIYTEPLISAELSQNYFGILAFKFLPSVLTGVALVLIFSAKHASKALHPLLCLLEYPYAPVFFL